MGWEVDSASWRGSALPGRRWGASVSLQVLPVTWVRRRLGILFLAVRSLFPHTGQQILQVSEDGALIMHRNS